MLAMVAVGRLDHGLQVSQKKMDGCDNGTTDAFAGPNNRWFRLSFICIGTTSMSDLKTLYLIRHAESLENERIGCLQRSLSDVGRLSLPRMSDLRRSVELINVPAQVDSDVSSVGWDQVRGARLGVLCSSFVQQINVCKARAFHLFLPASP